MIITKDLLERGKSVRNGWNRKQILALGEDQQVGGWYGRLIGKEIDEKQLEVFLALKDNHLKNYLAKKGLINKKFNKLKKPIFGPCNKVIEYKDQYLHPNWQKMRLFILNRDKFCCQECGAKEETLHVHHLKYNKNNYIWMVPTWYLVTLCDDCHSKEHGRDLKIKN